MDSLSGLELVTGSKLSEALRIPRRPLWDYNMDADELQRLENISFVSWRRNLALFQERNAPLVLTPYELNLDMWRELWRVIERSHLLIQIVDARNPLLFLCEDLAQYLDERQGRNTPMILLLNKADLLTEEQRAEWLRYFSAESIDCIFYSSTQCASEWSSLGETLNTTRICSPQGLISLFETFRDDADNSENLGGPSFNVGLVGYPNVGKSSAINSLLASKRVRVGATPGKTKHLQTIFLEENVDVSEQQHTSAIDEAASSTASSCCERSPIASSERKLPQICLVDCPGLVFPNFAVTKAELVVNGILPIDQLRDYIAPCDLVASRIPRNVLEDAYTLMLPFPYEGEDERRPPTGRELLTAYATARGSSSDVSRAARIILKDYVAGSKICYVHMPPGYQYPEQPHVQVEPAFHKQTHSQRGGPPSSTGGTPSELSPDMGCSWTAGVKGKFASTCYTRGLATSPMSNSHKRHYKRK